MKLSLNWLNDYVHVEDFKANPEPLVKSLTDAGLEIEALDNKAQKLDKVVVGEIVSLKPHPNADKLTYCEVNVGGDKPLHIVCGAKNHKEGDKVCVAQVGAVLPGDFKIKKSKIRGEESFGMLCSAKELEVTEEKYLNDGIIILPQEAPVGQDIASYLKLDDVILDVNVTPNRADCLSHLGLAREVGVLFDRELKTPPKTDIKSVKDKRHIEVKLEEPELCPRYAGCMVYNVQVSESPEWLKKRLESVGLSPINNIVDITNYIMLDTGQPLHAFDAAKISGDEIKVRKSKPGELFTTLDGTELKLDGEELVIADSDRGLALAGVIGGKNSGVSEETKDIFLEAAYFIPAAVRKTSRKFGIETDSCYRFSRGVDVSNVRQSMNYALSLIQDLSKGSVSESVSEAYPAKVEPASISITHVFLEEKLGFNVRPERVEEEFKKLGFNFERTQEESVAWQVTPKTFRHDITIKEDVVEEIARLVGYDKIPEELPPLQGGLQKALNTYEFEKRLRNQLCGLGFNEVIHYNFYTQAQEMKWAQSLENKEYWLISGAKSSHKPVSIQNPLSADTSLMRESCLPQFLSCFVKNYRMGDHEGDIFELGTSHIKSENSYIETSILGLGSWSAERDAKTNHERLIGRLSEVFRMWNINNWSLKPLNSSESPSLLHPKMTAHIVKEGKTIGFLYALHPKIHKENKIPASYSGAEINLEAFWKGQPRPNKYKEIARSPLVERDFSVKVPKSYDFQGITKTIKKSAPDLLKSVSLLEEYSGQGVEDGYLSLTVRARFQSDKKTLPEEEVKALHAKVLKNLENYVGGNT